VRTRLQNLRLERESSCVIAAGRRIWRRPALLALKLGAAHLLVDLQRRGAELASTEVANGQLLLRASL